MNKKEILSYETDASRIIGKAEKVIFPRKKEDVQNAVKNSGLDLVPRGGGTSQAGGTIPNNSVVIDMSKMNKILSFDHKKRIVEVEAGISIKELNEKLNFINLEFPIKSLNETSTIGGMVSINSPNPRSMKYGRIKDWVEEIEFVNGRGELMKTSKADLGDVCGTEGIMGIITSLRIKVIPKIERSAAVFQADNLEEILSMARKLKLENDVVMLELFPPEVSEMLELPKRYHLIIEFDSQRGKIKEEEYKKILELKKNAHFALINIGYYSSEESKFFFDKLKDFMLFLESNQIPYFGYPGDGVVNIFFRDNETAKRKQVIDLIIKIGGKFVNGIGIKRKDVVDAFEKKILNRVKLRHDPFGKFNRGKVFDFEARIAAGRHLKPLQGREIEEIRPFLGEKISAAEINEEERTPEEEMEEFIEKVEILEKIERPKEEKILDLTKQQEKPIEKEDPYSTKALLKEYEYTYDSESSRDKMTEIEKFAKKVPQTLSRETTEKKGKLTKEEEDIIKKVMMGQSVKEEKTDNQKENDNK